MTSGEPTYLNANPPTVGVRGDEVTMTIHGETYRMDADRARVLASDLSRKADLADPEGDE